MQTLRLIRVARHADDEAEPGPGSFVELTGEHSLFALVLSADGLLSAQPIAAAAHGCDEGTPVAYVRRQQQDEAEVWFVAPCSPSFSLNGQAPPLQLTTLEPGALLSIGTTFWLASLLWSPIPAAAPEYLAEKRCPVCGGELKLAPIVQCLCGRWVHLERPDVPDDPDALNCFFEGGQCGSCGHPATLDTQCVPEPTAALVGAAESDDAW
jgi:hypothetical protein